MSSFNSADIFGSAPHAVIIGDIEQQIQTDKPPATNGVMALNMGRKSTPITITGVRGNPAYIKGTDIANLITVENAIKAYLDGLAYTLVDNYGQSYTNVIMRHYSRRGHIIRVAGSTNHYVGYICILEQLV